MPLQRKINDVDIRLLRIYQAVVECGGFSAAEAELNIARSTISTHMADLESRLGIKLCNRGRSGFSLTDEGRFVYESALQLFSSLESFRSQVNTLHQQLTGELHIICSDAIVTDPRCRLSDALREFTEAAPEVYLNVSTNTMAEIERALIDGRADIGFAPWHRDLSSIAYQPLYRENYFLYCHRSHPLFAVPAEELTREQVHASPFIHLGLQTSSQASRAMAGLNRSATAYIFEVRMALLNTGRYIGFFPSHYAQPWLERGELRALMPEEKYYEVEIAAMTRSTRRQNPVLSLFMEKLMAAYEKVGEI